MLSNCGAIEKHLRVLWTAVFTERTVAEAEAPVSLAPWCRFNSLEKTLTLGKIEGRRRGQQRMRWLDASPTQWT